MNICNHTRFNSEEAAIDYALNHDALAAQCPFCKLWGVSYASSEEDVRKAHAEYRKILRERFPKLER